MTGNHGSLRERFYRHVNAGSDGCWNWKGSLNNQGYGMMWGGRETRKYIKAHRASWLVHFGPIPDGMLVCHKCDNPACVRPEHLHLGTTKDNMREASERKRMGKSRGEKHYRARLTEAAVRAMRADREDGRTLDAIAAHFGVSQVTAWRVINRTSWKHVA